MTWHSMPPQKRKTGSLTLSAQMGCSRLGLVVLSLFGLCSGMLLWGVLAFLFWHDNRLDTQGIVTDAVIENMYFTQQSKGNGQNLNLVYRYSVAEQGYTGRYQSLAPITETEAFQAGKALMIRYLPDDPYLSRVEDARLTQTGHRLLVSLIIAGTGAVAVFTALRGLWRSIKT